jgi:galactokinase
MDGYKLLLLNTNVKHSLASSEYNTRRRECETAVEWVRQHVNGVNSLRDVTEAMLDQYVAPKDAVIDNRARFVVQEIARLQAACEDLQRGDLSALGKKMVETHDGLSKLYEVSCPELDWLVDQVRNRDEVLGARMMGGGFGGCTINLVREDAIEGLVAALAPAYKKEMNRPLTHYVVSTENGTEIIA